MPAAPLRDALDLAYLAGQSPADTLPLIETHIRDSFLPVHQGKTGYRAENKVVSIYLMVNESGLPLTDGALRDRFDKAREAAGVQKTSFQFRGLRGKAGTDKNESAEYIQQTQKQLGHGSVTTTER